MSTTDWKGWAVAALLVAIGAWVALAPRGASAVRGGAPTEHPDDGSARVAPRAAPRAAVEDDSFWWAEAGQQSGVTLWIGPSSIDVHGLGIRHWTLSTFLPGSERPLSCLQGTAGLDGAARIRLRGAEFHVEARPLEGLTWGEVVSREQLAVDLNGFH
jgi:hypothetical protein